VSDPKKVRNSHEIHLVNEADQLSAREPSQSSNNRLEIGDYIADILVDKRSYPVVVHWIVQRRGNPEILQWGHEDNFEDASREAIDWIESLLRFDDYRRNSNR
jgi:hypothetical protein